MKKDLTESPATSPEPASCPSCGLPEKHFPYGAQYCPDKWHESPGGAMTNLGKTPEREAGTMRQTYAYEAFRENYHDSYVDPKDAFDAGYRAGAEARATAEKIVSLHKENADLRRQRDAWQEDARLRATNTDYWKERAETAERQLQEALNQLSVLTRKESDKHT